MTARSIAARTAGHRRSVESRPAHDRADAIGAREAAFPSAVEMIQGLQRTSGNAAVSRLISRVNTIQRCGPTPCGCSPQERQDREGAGEVIQRIPAFNPSPAWAKKGKDQGQFACLPFSSETTAQLRWAFWSNLFPAEAGSRCTGCGSVKSVWDRYFEATGGSFNFREPGNDVVTSLRNDDDHAPIEDPILRRIEGRIPALAPRLAGKTSVDISLDDAGLNDVHKPDLVFNNNTRAGGQLLGGIGSSVFGDDTRKLDGTIHLDRTKSGGGIEVSGQVRFKYDHTDGVDFCPGNTGEAAALIVQGAVTEVSRLEASGMARDVFVEAHYERVRNLVPQRTFNPDGLIPPGPITPRNVVVPAVLFDFDSDKLKADAEKTLLTALGDSPRRADPTQPFRVRGHTDSKGQPSYNLGLSKRRAETIKALLEREFPNLRGRVETEGLGAAEPVAPNTIAGQDNPEGRRQNRRVEIKFSEIVGP